MPKSIYNFFILKLSKQGFRNIDAIDGSEAMLSKLREKGIYKNATKVMLTNGNFIRDLQMRLK